MPLFSTIIPVYNRAALIRATLDSVLAQDLPDQEVIVVDDGSTDDTVNTLESYGNRIRVLQQKNSGPAVARNLGIQHAAGEYIAILDSDDLWFPWTLATYTEAIRENDSPAFSRAARPWCFMTPLNCVALAKSPLKAERFDDYPGVGRSMALVWSVPRLCFGTEAVRAVGCFSDEWINSDDADLALRLGVARGFVDIQALRDHSGLPRSCRAA